MCCLMGEAMRPHELANVAINVILLAAVLYGGFFYALIAD